MAYLELNREALAHNYQFLADHFHKNQKHWGVVTKVLCGHKTYLEEVLKLHTGTVFDSRLSNLKAIRKLQPETRTVYIKPPPKRIIPKLLEVADVSFNTQLSTIRLINEEAIRQDKIHQIIIMIEMGDLREGVMRDDILDFYANVFELSNIEVIGLGTNLNCLNGVMPSYDKLIQLSLYKELIEATFHQKIEWVTAGTSVVFPLLEQGLVPTGMNHFRMGETLYFGNNLITGEPLPGMRQDVFRLYAEIVEIMEKPEGLDQPTGVNAAGVTPDADQFERGRTRNRALIDTGLLDIHYDNLKPVLQDLSVEGASSDMLVVDVGNNDTNLNTGNHIAFQVNYMGLLSLMNSRYIEKKLL
ncbi:MAG: alanine racemase [Chitinophagales bacterium]|nr:alanine racemase [Chitinophagales bacterium]HAE34396.1 amino-acid racemase [Bacteroidota bacterium]MCB9018900.1 alanine racemase [Chitinophagales bacterium]MCB9022578.1 alanine racemase [Chitinophagales bacterium]HPE97131.1 alanine racemase [Chitinophagales bacterium]